MTLHAKRRSLHKGLILTLAVLFVLLLPVLVYLWTFGTTLSDDHQRWSEMGSAMAGIYTPILAVLTLAVLVAQVRLQASMNRHTFDESFVQQAREKISFSLDQLAKELTREFEDGSDVQARLVETFAFADVKELAQPASIEVAKLLKKKHHRLISLWSEFYAALAGLRVHDYHPYNTAFINTRQRAISMFSHAGCAALDNLVWCASEGKLNFGYEFSISNLPPRAVDNPIVNASESSLQNPLAD